MANVIINPIVSFLYGLGPIDANFNQIVENQKSSDIEILKPVQNQRSEKNQRDINELFFYDDQPKIIIISGMAGDGKTHLIRQLLQTEFTNELSDFKDKYGSPYRKIDLESFQRQPERTRKFSSLEHYLLTDLSEFSKESPSLPEFNEDFLKILAKDQNCRKVLLVAANYGALLTILEDALPVFKSKYQKGLSSILDKFELALDNLKCALLDHQPAKLNHLLSKHSPAVTGDGAADSAVDSAIDTAKHDPIYFFDMSQVFDMADFTRLAFDILNHEAWQQCDACSAKGHCPIYNNRQLLTQGLDTNIGNTFAQKDAQEINSSLYRVLLLLQGLGEHLTIRNMFELLSNTILGYVKEGPVSSKDKPILNCHTVHKRLQMHNNPDTKFSFSLSYTPNLSNKVVQSAAIGEVTSDQTEVVWYSNPFDNLLGLNLVNFNKDRLKLNSKAATIELPVIFTQLERLKLGNTSSANFEQDLRDRLQAYRQTNEFYQINQAAKTQTIETLRQSHPITAAERSLLQEIYMLKQHFEQIQLLSNKKQKIAETEKLQSLLNQACSSWFRLCFFTQKFPDGIFIKYDYKNKYFKQLFRLTDFPSASDFFALSKWAQDNRAQDKDARPAVLQQIEHLNEVWQKLQLGLFNLFTHNLRQSDLGELPVPMVSKISSQPCSMLLSENFKLQFGNDGSQDQSKEMPQISLQHTESGQNLIRLVVTFPKLRSFEPTAAQNRACGAANGLTSGFTSGSTNGSSLSKIGPIKLANSPEICDLTLDLHLHDFEYLMQLSTGLMPQSLSRECNSRFQQFRERIFGQLAVYNQNNRSKANSAQDHANCMFASLVDLNRMSDKY